VDIHHAVAGNGVDERREIGGFIEAAFAECFDGGPEGILDYIFGGGTVVRQGARGVKVDAGLKIKS